MNLSSTTPGYKDILSQIKDNFLYSPGKKKKKHEGLDKTCQR